MGTTMSFINIQNRNFTQGELAKLLAPFREDSQEGSIASLARLMEQAMAHVSPEARAESEDFLRKLKDGSFAAQYEAYRAQAPAFAQPKPSRPGPLLAYRADAPWLPLFQTRLCDGNIADSRDALRLSRQFGAPVLIYALFDSDVLFLSYGDDFTQTAWDYAKPNWEDFEDYDTRLYSTQFPEFLLDLCPPERRGQLRTIWDEADEVFADDRMAKLSQLLDTQLLYGTEELPQGFAPVFAAQP